MLLNNNPKKILIIAGSDSGGGAGIQADIKTATAYQTYCSTIITTLTAQNTKSVTAIESIKVDFLNKQFDAVLSDIDFDAIKIGMLSNSAIIKEVSRNIKKYNLRNIVLDPVMIATSGDKLLDIESISYLRQIISQVFLVTPNIDEAEILVNKSIKTLADIKNAAKEISNMGPTNVLIKGGHANLKEDKIRNVLLDSNGNYSIISNKRLFGNDFHGTGCSLSTAIACNIAFGLDIKRSVQNSNRYIARSLSKSLKVGKGSRVLRHYI